MVLIVDKTDEVRFALDRATSELKDKLGSRDIDRLLGAFTLSEALAECKAKDIRHVALIDPAVARLSRNWLTEGVGLFAAHQDIGAVGGQVLLPDGRIAWRGGFRGFGGLAGSPDYGRDAADSGYHGMGWCQRSCDSVSSACFFSITDLLQAALASIVNDSCSPRLLAGHVALAAWQRDLRVVYTPFVRATLAREVAADPIFPRSEHIQNGAKYFYHPAFGRRLCSAYSLLPITPGQSARTG
jgi:hypothetical protein